MSDQRLPDADGDVLADAPVEPMAGGLVWLVGAAMGVATTRCLTGAAGAAGSLTWMCCPHLGQAMFFPRAFAPTRNLALQLTH